MPGVPSGKGCDACRKQKKKCDWNARRSICSRCRRLQVSCIGGGQQRYKFMIQNHNQEIVQLVAKQSRPRYRLDIHGRLMEDMWPSYESHKHLGTLCYGPSNSHTRLVNSFLEKVNPSLGVQYNLAWTFGDYLAEVPRRLGSNPALDAAADAMLAGYDRFSGMTPEEALLPKYNHAIRTLRLSLNEPDTARDTGTLCAVMMLMVCQMFAGGSCKHPANHAEGALQLLKLRDKSHFQDPFAKKLMVTLTGPLLFQGLFLEEIPYTDEEWLDIFDDDKPTDNPMASLMQDFARIPSLMRKIKSLFREESYPDFTKIEAEARTMQQNVKMPLRYLEEQLSKVRAEAEHSGPSKSRHVTSMIYCVYLRLRSLGLAIAILVNHIHAAVIDDPEAICQSRKWTIELLEHAKSSRQFRPLGAATMPLCLEIAWMAVDDPIMRDQIDQLLAEFESDFWAQDVEESGFVNYFAIGRGRSLLYTFDKRQQRRGTVQNSPVATSEYEYLLVT